MDEKNFDGKYNSGSSSGVKTNDNNFLRKKSALGIFAIVFGGLIFLAILIPKIDSLIKKAEQKVQYQIFDREDISFPGRKRIDIGITATTKNFDERIAVVKQAAIDLIKNERAKVASVFLYDIPLNEDVCGGMNVAIATYAPDGGGWSGDQKFTWKLSATETNLSEKQKKVLVAYCQEKDINLGQKEIINRTAKKVNMSSSEVNKIISTIVLLTAQQKTL
jgi:hypothetical protein